ncbi:MAG: phospholipid/cholesterol/gamma-HCH transport system substrate-binding protein, partial [Mycobacterium sp.]|nr:phospholipid/cholesterol/gamma-HCH transport system substrate-binding protein [Mycobacterium sp.]
MAEAIQKKRAGESRIHPAVWTLILLVLIVVLIAVTSVLFAGSLSSYVPVTLTSDRAG